MSAIEHALLAVRAARGGDRLAADGQLLRARASTGPAARRERQVVEIAALVVVGQRARAEGLALEHTLEFADDDELLAQVIGE